MSAGGIIVDLVELIENPGELVRRDTDAGIPYVDSQALRAELR